MAEVTILERTEVLSADPTRLGKWDVWFTYQTADGRQGVAIIPRELATEAALIKELQRLEAERSKALSKPINI
jgi:hypothetical protein